MNSDLSDLTGRAVMIGSKEKDSYSTQKPSSRPSLISNPHQKDLYFTERISTSNSKLVGSTSSSYDSCEV